jgi:glycosidase
MGLVLDYVPNHVARDHLWVQEAPELFMRGRDGGILPGRDPYFPPWPDTAQLDFRVPRTRSASIDTLRSIAGRCDGVRCDMAMLVLEDTFRRTWASTPKTGGEGEARGEFWAEAIDSLRKDWPNFLLIAEAYWDLEWHLQMLGFDYTYDKSFYDRLVHGSPASIRAHLTAKPDYQRRSVRFLENHDEPRLASVLPKDRRKAAMVLAATVPGMRFFHDGQLEGRQIRASVHLRRRAEEPIDAESRQFYETLFMALHRPALRRGTFATLTARSAGSQGSNGEPFVAHRWDSREGAVVVVVVNFGPRRGQCRITLDIAGTAGRTIRLSDLLTAEEYLRNGDELLDPARGLFVDLPPYGVHLLEVGRT